MKKRSKIAWFVYENTHFLKPEVGFKPNSLKCANIFIKKPKAGLRATDVQREISKFNLITKRKTVMDEQKLEQMRSVLNKLEDIKNTQESIIDKINHVITDLFQHPDKDLEKVMEEAHQKASDNVDAVREAMDDYEMRINKIETQG